MTGGKEPGNGPKWNWSRWGVFNLVGILGFAVQLGALFALKSFAGLSYLKATGIAVECAVLHNFVWHESVTWKDIAAPSGRGVLGRLLRFHLANGIISILGNTAITWLLVERVRCPYLLANAMSVAACSVGNFLAGDRFVFTGQKSRFANQELKWMRC
jgi:putative flippase GtrA